MKKIILVISTLVFINSGSAQHGKKDATLQKITLPVDSTTGKVVYQGIIKVDTIGKRELYTRAKDWVVRTLKSSDNNINLDDKDFNSLTATGNIMLPDIGNRMSVMFTERYFNLKISIYFKDGRVKYVLENIVHSCMKTMKFPIGPFTNGIEDLQSLQGMNEKWRNETYGQVDAKIKGLIESLSVVLKKTKQGDSGKW